MAIDEKYIEDLDSGQLRNRNSIDRIASNIVDDAKCDDYLLVKLADRLLGIGELEAAVRVTEMLDEAWATETIPLLCRLAESLAVRGEVRQARRLLIRALIASEDCDVGWERAQALISVARAFGKLEDVDIAASILHEAVAFAKEDEAHGMTNIQDAMDASGVLGEIAVNLAEFGFPEEGREIAGNLVYPRGKTVALLKIDRIQKRR